METELKGLSTARKTQETALESMKKVEASLENQRKLVETLATALERSQAHLSGLQTRLARITSYNVCYTKLLREIGTRERHQVWHDGRGCGVSGSQRIDQSAGSALGFDAHLDLQPGTTRNKFVQLCL